MSSSCKKEDTSGVSKKNSPSIDILGHKNLSCEGISNTYSFDFDTYYLVPKSILPKADDLSELYNNIAYYSLLYLTPNSPNHDNNIISAGLKNFNGENFEITSTSETNLPYSLEILKHESKEDSYFTDKTLLRFYKPQAQEYLKNAYEKKYIPKGEPAVKLNIRYKNLEINLCLKDDQKLVNFFYSHSPFLSYYMIPKNMRRPLKHPFHKVLQVNNPCAETSLAHYNGVDPLMYLWHWDPKKSGLDFENKKFNCQELLKENIHYSRFQPKLTEVPESKSSLRIKELAKKKEPLKIGFINGFSVNVEEMKRFNPTHVKQIINKVIENKEFKIAKKIISSETNDYDFNFKRYLILLWNIAKNTRIIERKVSVDDQLLVTRLAIEFQSSRKKAVVDMVMTPTYFTEDLKKYKDFKEYFSYLYYNYDVFFYTGHSGSGENIDSNKLGLFDFPEENKNKNLKYQLVTFNTCEAYSKYYDGKYPKIHKDLQRDLILTTSPAINVTSNYLIGIFDQIDKVLAGKEEDPFNTWVKKYKVKSSFILMN